MSIPQDIAPERLAALLRTDWLGRQLEVKPQTSSTMDDALAAIEQGAQSGVTIVADHQTRARGSQGRSWDTVAGQDLYVSFVLRRQAITPELPVMTLAVGLGIAEAIDAHVRAVIKWPNDVYVADRKCAGILVESRVQGTSMNAVVGFGINVNRLSLPPGATSLRAEVGTELDRAALLANVLRSVESAIDRFDREGAAQIAAAVDARLLWRHRKVCIDDRSGELLGVASDGSARLLIDGKPHDIRSGRLMLDSR